MNEAIDFMLKRYQCHSVSDYSHALKEIIQEIALLGLWRAKFFEKAAFYGGTALRILYGLDRFSEDLDFSLLEPNATFQLSSYLAAVQAELSGFGFDVVLENKIKTVDTAIQSAFIKAGTKQHLLKIKISDALHRHIHLNEVLKIKIEVDIDPPGAFYTESKLLLQPIPFNVISYQQPDLFAGKLHAVLCRQWKARVKGRDWYDLVWYLSQHIPVRIAHLQERLIQTGAWPSNQTLTREDLLRLLHEKIENIDIALAKKEVLPFLADPKRVQMWSKEFFKQIIARLETV